MGLNAAPAAADTQPFIGEVATFAFRFCPKGWAPLNGQLMAISQNTALFSLLGTTYGGDGRSTFALPLAKPTLTLTQGAPLIQCIALLGVFPSQN
jgi:microcystin-dependent protein